MNNWYYNVHFMNTGEKQESLTLGILEAIEKNQEVTQRHLANDLGVALGLANSYMKRCARKGFIKIQQAPANRYLYYLTPKGFIEKSRLTAKFLSTSLGFYRRASNDYFQLLKFCEKSGYKKIALCGLSELAEIASIRIHESDREIVAVYDANSGRDKFLGIPVYVTLRELPELDAILLTEMNKSVEMLIEVSDFYANRRPILVPEFLKFIQDQVVDRSHQKTGMV